MVLARTVLMTLKRETTRMGGWTVIVIVIDFFCAYRTEACFVSMSILNGKIFNKQMECELRLLSKESTGTTRPHQQCSIILVLTQSIRLARSG